MKVLIIYLIVFVINYIIIIQYKGNIFATRTANNNTASDDWQYFYYENNMTSVLGSYDSAQQAKYLKCENETFPHTYILDKQCFSDVTLKLLYASVISVATAFLPLRKMLKQRTKIVKTKLQAQTKLNHLRDILNAITVGVISTDSKKRITFMNFTAGKMCGWCPRNAVGKSISDVVRFKNKEDTLSAKNVLLSKDEGSDLVLHSREGRDIDVQRIVSPLFIQGETEGTVTLLLDVTASRELVRQLNYSASHDALTGLPNRASFDRRLRNAVIRSEEENVQHSVAFVDLDGFKQINDTAGHAAGDELLKQIARQMQLPLRHSDFVARLGGDEFGIILYNCGLLQAKILMDLVVNIINEYSFCWDGEIMNVGASAGISSVSVNSKDIGKILAEADAACYAAKRRGKGQVCLPLNYEETLI